MRDTKEFRQHVENGRRTQWYDTYTEYRNERAKLGFDTQAIDSLFYEACDDENHPLYKITNKLYRSLRRRVLWAPPESRSRQRFLVVEV